jgi:hypothetical protein
MSRTDSPRRPKNRRILQRSIGPAAIHATVRVIHSTNSSISHQSLAHGCHHALSGMFTAVPESLYPHAPDLAIFLASPPRREVYYQGVIS